MSQKPAAPATPKIPAKTKRFLAAAKRAVEANGAGRTPSPVLKTFFPPSLEISGLRVSRAGLGILGVLEAIKHPFIEQAFADAKVEDVRVTIGDIQVALYVFAEPRAAKDAHAQGKLVEAAENWVFENQIPADAVTKAPFVLVRLIQGEMGMIPGFDPAAEAAGKGGAAPLDGASAEPPASPSATPA